MSVLLLMGCAALAAVFLVYWIATSGRAVRQLGTSADPSGARLPLLWRVGAPLIGPLAHSVGAWLVSPSGRLTERLRRAGLSAHLTPPEFQSGRLVLGAAFAALAGLVGAPLGLGSLGVLCFAAALGWFLPSNWLSDQIKRKESRMLKELPFFLDVLTLALESGMNLTGALNEAISKGPVGPMRRELAIVVRDLRSGRSRDETLRALADRTALAEIGSLASALLAAERQGVSLGPILRAQAEQRRNERFHRAEKLAMEAPVKMLLPLLLFIFPCTFLILFFPVASRIVSEGWFK